jgi:uncharacterized protein YqgV (UPF0045/DUF77 family)
MRGAGGGGTFGGRKSKSETPLRELRAAQVSSKRRRFASASTTIGWLHRLSGTRSNRMDIGVEISLYPLHQHYLEPIKDFIARLNADGQLRVVTNSMSTQIFGDFDVLMQRLTREVRVSFESSQRAVFVLKILGPMPT